MIEINLTLLVQAFHFFVAYLLIRYLFLEPILQIIYQKEKKEHDLIASIARHKQNVAVKEQDKKNIWKHCQRYFISKTPNLHDPELISFSIKAKSISIPTISDDQIKHNAKILKETIMESWR